MRQALTSSRSTAVPATVQAGSPVVAGLACFGAYCLFDARYRGG
jgi:hypothetical protein